MKTARLINCILICILLLVMPCGHASATQATSYTYTLDENDYYVRTQDAYLPDKTITSLGLSHAEDIFIDADNIMYIVDSGNKRIIKYDIDNGVVSGELKYSGFATPKGVYVTSAGEIYVADAGAKKVYRFNAELDFIAEYGRPDTPIFGDTNFEPMKIAVDNSGNMYIIGEGVYNGVIQLAHTGEFLGYFTVNKTKLTFSQAIQKLIFSREQLANLVDTVPTTFSNVFIDSNGIVYTTTMGSKINPLKKHNTAGGNMFKEDIYGWADPSDVYVDSDGIIYVSCTSGFIQVYSKNGEFIFDFGTTITDIDIAGLFSSLTSIAVDKNGNIWGVDGDKGYLQSFKKTEYAQMIYSAMGLYEEGRYDEALAQWSDVLRLNQMSVLAHNGVGKAQFHAQLYAEAMEHFEVAGNRTFYSDAFWEVRNEWIQKYLVYIFFTAIALMLLSAITKRVDKRHRIKNFKHLLFEKASRVPILKDILYAFRIARHPIDRYYDIRVKKAGNVAGASFIYILFFAVYMLYQTSKGFIYQYTAVEDLDIGGIVVGFFAILILFIICNYLVTSINDGDGTFKQVYMIPAYGAMPLLIGMAAIIILSYGMTYNESFILTIIKLVCIIWTIANIFLGLMTVHDYSFGETIKSILMTVFFMLIVAVMGTILTIMCEQLWQFLLSVGKELVNNVF